MKTIIFTAAAAKHHDALPADAREEVDIALNTYAADGRGDVKRLQGSPYYRLRIGRYRVVFDEDQTTILAIYIGKRETTTYRGGRTTKDRRK
jgi:mRNA interferase RelE/StbE